MTRANDPLLQPFQLRHLRLRNRLLSTAHEPAYSEDGMPKARYRAYQVEKARGGIGLTMMGGSMIVAPDSPPAFGNLHLYKDEIVPWLRELTDAVHAEGAAIMCQITHLGRRTSWSTGDWLPLVSASPVRESAHRAFPKAAEDWDIARIVQAYADAAARCREGGMDGLEVEAYGHLLDSFWSPLTNHRDDEYGGSLENRMRFSLQVLDAIRAAVGPEFIVGYRMVVDEEHVRGLSREEGMAIARRLVATGKLDFINVIQGRVESDEALSHVIPNMGTPAGPHLELAGEVRRRIGVPVFHAARISDVATARHAVAEGLVDMVGMTRPYMADPHIGIKVQRGEEDRIRPCVGAGYCIDRIYYGGDALCIHNPATGRELGVPHVLTRSPDAGRRVVIIGAGPAGLEAARVCGERGHHVVVFEAADQPGGQIRLGAAVPRRREFIGIVDWRMAECDRFGVQFRFNTWAEADDVLAEEPDVVIVATGGLPHTGFLAEGEELVTTTWDILSGSARPGREVLLFDDNGSHPAMVAAEAMVERVECMELVTPERTLGVEIGGTNYPVYFRMLAEHGVTVTLNERLTAVHREGSRLAATLFNEYARRETVRLVDQVVVEHGTLPLEDLYFALREGSANRGEVDQAALIAGRPQSMVRNPEGRYRLYRVGDAVASRNIHAAVYDALRLCMVM